jgi:hypothetical protein
MVLPFDQNKLIEICRQPMSCRVKGLNLKILNQAPTSSWMEEGNTSPSRP